MLLAEIRLADECHDCQMLVDSGADNIVLPRYMLELFGLEEADCTVHRGFTLSGYVQALTGPVFQLAFPELWPDSSLSSQIVFAEWLDERGYGLLG